MRTSTLLIALVCGIFALATIGCGEDAASDTTDTAGAADAGATGGQQCAACAKDNDCGDGLTCDKPAFVCKTPEQVKVGKPVCNEDCKEWDPCKEAGLCTMEGKICIAKILAHCVASDYCKNDGRCSVVDGACQVQSDADCLQSNACKNDGKCTHKDGKCDETTGVKCGDGKCEGNETKQTCPKDCGKVGGEDCPCDKGMCGIKPGCPNDCGGCDGDKWCFANTCTDAKCALPKTWPKKAQRISKLVLLNNKLGCDLDDSGKAKNMLGNLLKVYSGVNEHAFNALQAQTLNLLFVADDYHAGGKSFAISMIEASLDKTAGACNPEQAACKYQAMAHSYNVLAKADNCPPVTSLDGAKVSDNKLTVGGTGASLDLAVHVVGVPLVAKLQAVRVSGEVTGGSEWQTTTKGMICGAMKMSDLDAAVQTLPESALKGTGFTKKKVKELVAGLFTADIDLDGDGTFDAMSAAWSFETHQAELLGVK